MSKTNYYIFLSLVVVIILIFIGTKSDILKNLKNFGNSETKISEQADLTGFKFKGQLVSIEGDIIKIKGFFTSSSTPLELRGETTYSFRIDSGTNFRKLQIQMPSYESLRNSGKENTPYNIKDLPREELPGSLEDLKSSSSKGFLLVEGIFVNSTFETKNPIAAEVFYQLLLTPPDQTL